MSQRRKLKPIVEPPILYSAPRIKQNYFNWLCSVIGASTPTRHYKKLSRRLHLKEFRWTIPNDDNRESDGKKLRGMFIQETNPHETLGDHYVFTDDPASCLEVLIALAIRIEDMLTDEFHGDRTEDWFWMMVDNLGLLAYSDADFFDLFGDREIERSLEKWLDRRLDWNGYGGIFPLKRHCANQREVEIWYQMMAYLTENAII